LKIYVIYRRGNQQRVFRKLNSLKLFSKIERQEKNQLRLETKKPIYAKNKLVLKKFVRFFESMKHVKEAKLYLDTEKEKHRRKKHSKILHLFFDIDSTLTHTGVKTINKEVKSVFEDFKTHGCRIYFCTGRSVKDVKDLNEKYELGDYGIAEGGGIIIGVGSSNLGYHRFGKRTEPDKFITYLNQNEIPYEEDSNQSNRLSEWVLRSKSIGKMVLRRAIGNSRAKVEPHFTKNTIHITGSGINKGTAINFLASDVLELDSKTHYTIGVGDSDLDIEMFNHCDESYAVGNDKKIRRHARYRLKKMPPKSVSELYNRLFPY